MGESLEGESLMGESLTGGFYVLATFYNFRFVKRKTQKDYIRIDEGVGCSSGIGMWGIGKQNVTLGPLCNSMGTILHELMHVIG